MTLEGITAVKSVLIKGLWRFLAVVARDFSPETEAVSWLIVAPHPDDETLGCGAAIIRARQAGHAVRVVVATDGRAAENPSGLDKNEDLIAKREAETKEACLRLGVEASGVVFLRFKDGEANGHIDALAQCLDREITRCPPQGILAPSSFDKHPDHRACALAIDRLRRAGKIVCPVMDYVVWLSITGFLFRLLPLLFTRRLRRVAARNVAAQKIKAFEAHVSQYGDGFSDPERKRFWSRYFGSYEIFIKRKTVRRV